MRVIEASELIAVDVFTAAEQTRAAHLRRRRAPSGPAGRPSDAADVPELADQTIELLVDLGGTAADPDDEPATAAAEDQDDEETSRPRRLRLRFKALGIR